MELNFDMKMLENLSEGVVLLNKSGHITDFNKAASPWLKPCFNAAEKLATLIQEIIRDKNKSPVSVKILGLDERNAKPVKTYLCSNGEAGYALLFTPIQTLPVTQAADQRQGVFILISAEIRHKITKLQEQLANISHQNAPLDLTAIIQNSAHLNRLMAAIDLLSQLNEVDSISPGERISLEDLVSDVLGSMTHRRCDYTINAPQNDYPDHMGVVYGNAEWLKCGLRGLLEGLDEGATAKNPIELKVRQSGGFVVLTAKFLGDGDSGITGATKPVSMASAAMGVAADIRVPIARRIFELHGGQLKIVEIDADNPDEFRRGISSFTLILPTGSPGKKRNLDCDNCLVGQQAWAYASDLAKVMPISPVASDLSKEELEFLMHVMGAN